MVTLYTINNKLVKAGSKFLGVIAEPEPPTPPGPTFDEVTIGTQTWMAKNLAIDDGQGGIYTRTVNYGQGDVVEHYYTWDAALRVSESINGWHLPSSNEWSTLITAVGSNPGTKLKSTYAWENNGNGTDDYGFSTLPAGDYSYNSFLPIGYVANFWSSNAYSSSNALYEELDTSSSAGVYAQSKTFGKSVRLIKDS